MEWATDIFSIDNRDERSAFAIWLWRSTSVDRPSFISIAVATVQLVFVQSADGTARVIARGPET
jgi:hypothetical protein